MMHQRDGAQISNNEKDEEIWTTVSHNCCICLSFSSNQTEIKAASLSAY